MTFKSEVMACSELRAGFRPGLQALRKADRKRVVCGETQRLAGSIDLQKALQARYHNEPLWDYGIGLRSVRKEEAVWIEIHPASSNHVREVISKAAWLKKWLGAYARGLLQMTRKTDGCVWIATSGVSLSRNSRQARELANNGVSFPQKRLHLL